MNQRATAKVLCYYLGLTLLLVHEMDAVHHREWRLLYGLRSLSDTAAYPTFLWLHVPLYVLVLWLSHLERVGIQTATRTLVSAFLVIHAGIHSYVAGTPGYSFDTLSNLFLYGAAVMGLLYLILREPERNSAGEAP